MGKVFFKLIFIFMISFLSSTELKKSGDDKTSLSLYLPYQQDQLNLIEEYYKKNHIKVFYDLSENKFLTIEYGLFKKSQNILHFDQRRWTFKNTFLPDNQKYYKTSLQLMKALKSQMQKEDPYSFWKLISVKDENDILFEKKSLNLSISGKTHSLIRVIKDGYFFYIISLTKTSDYFDHQDKLLSIEELNQIKILH